MDKEQKIEQRKKLSTICKGLGFILLAFMLFMPKWFVVFPILLIFASWGFYIDGQRLMRKDPAPIQKNQKKQAFERLVSRYGEPSERIDFKKDRYDHRAGAGILHGNAHHVSV